MAINSPMDRLKSVRNRCVIEIVGGVFVFSLCFLDFSVGVGLIHRTESDLFPNLLTINRKRMKFKIYKI